MGDIVRVTGLTKRFGDVAAVDGASFEVREGEIFGLLGPNGAGKTTTISMVSCLLEPSGGDIEVDGHSVRTDASGVKRVLGVVPQEIALYPTLSAFENLRFWGRMYGLSGALLKERVAEALELAGLADRAKDRIEKYSGGMKRRINIAAGVLHHPKVLLMDEPTVGIDPQSRNHILETVERLNAEGMTVVYTSHYMEEVEQLCDRVAIVDHGRVIACGTKEELRGLVGDLDVVTVAADDVSEDALGRLRDLAGVERVERTESALAVLSPDAGHVLAPVLRVLAEAGARVHSVRVQEPDLESVFLHLTGTSLRD